MCLRITVIRFVKISPIILNYMLYNITRLIARPGHLILTVLHCLSVYSGQKLSKIFIEKITFLLSQYVSKLCHNRQSHQQLIKNCFFKIAVFFLKLQA